jgi:hypothetical protein
MHESVVVLVVEPSGFWVVVSVVVLVLVVLPSLVVVVVLELPPWPSVLELPLELLAPSIAPPTTSEAAVRPEAIPVKSAEFMD